MGVCESRRGRVGIDIGETRMTASMRSKPKKSVKQTNINKCGLAAHYIKAENRTIDWMVIISF